MRILIIDDEASAAITLKALLMSQDGYEIDVAYDGHKGLEMMDGGKYDLIILDVMMPDFSGIDVCKEMAKNDKFKNIPVLLASALPINSKQLSGLMDEFKTLNVVKGALEKPFILEDIINAIKKIV